MEILVLLLLLVIVTYLYINSMLYVKKIKKTLLNIEEPTRIGYYKRKCNQGDGKYTYTGVFNIIEIDRYTNGDSKIKLKYIEIQDILDSKLNQDSAKLYLNSTFISLVKTDDIEWLESVVDIKDIRLKKLQELKKIFKKE